MFISILFILVVIICTIFTVTKACATENTRKEIAVFVGIDEETGAYIYQTEDGHKWLIYDAPEIYAELTFDSNGTDFVEDDTIIGFEEIK